MRVGGTETAWDARVSGAGRGRPPAVSPRRRGEENFVARVLFCSLSAALLTAFMQGGDEDEWLGWVDWDALGVSSTDAA